MQNQDSAPHEMDKASFTADGIAARRTLMDIPYAQDIYDVLLEKVSDEREAAELRDALKPEHLSLVPFFEARYLILDRLIQATGTKKILELAAGLAPRGLNWTDDPEVEYVELDLPSKSEQKRNLIGELAARTKISAHPNLHFEPGDATSASDLARSTSYFLGQGPIVIANEGLLRYLTFDQKRSLASNILNLLKQRGGYWITPDINLPEQILNNDPKLKNFMSRVGTRINMDMQANLFESIPAARKFFESCGFTIQEHSFREVVPEMVSPARLNLSPEEVEKLIGWRVAFVMKPATL